VDHPSPSSLALGDIEHRFIDIDQSAHFHRAPRIAFQEYRYVLMSLIAPHQIGGDLRAGIHVGNRAT
jgi:hypothetical protein